MASMNPRGNSFIVRWRAGRNGKWQTCTFHDEDLAKTAQSLAEARHHKISDADVYKAILDLSREETEADEPSTAPLLKDFIEEWLSLKVDIRPRTKQEYTWLLRGPWLRQSVGGLEPLAEMRVDEIDRFEHIDVWKAGVSQALKPATVRKHWSVVGQVLGDTVPKYRADDPFALPIGQSSHGLPTIEPYNAYFMTSKEAEILVASCPPAIRDIVLVALGTGMRLSELLGLQVSAVSLSGDHPKVYVEQSLSRTGGIMAPKSKRSRRPIPLPAATVEVFARLIAGKGRDELVFTSPQGKPWDANNFRWRFWRYAVAAAQRCATHPPKAAKVGNGAAVEGVKSMAVSTCACPTRLHQPPRFHDLRHSYVAYLIDAEYDFLAIQQMVGHASIKTTFDTYGHRLASRDKKLLKRLNGMLPSGATVRQLEDFERARKKTKKSKVGRKAKVSPFIQGLEPAA